MAIEQPGFKVGFMEAAADYSDGAKQYRIMKVTGDKAFGVCSVDGEAAFGVLQDKPKQGKPGELVVSGVTKVIVGTDVTAGQQFQSDANGAAKPAAATKAALGTVLIGAVAGKLATVFIAYGTGAKY